MSGNTRGKPEELLRELLALGKETEWLEFKEAKTKYDFDKLGRYFSALCNESNLKSQKCGWLILGVSDDRRIVGTVFRSHAGNLEQLKSDVAQHTTSNLTFIEIHELILQEGRVLMFQIPPAPAGLPVAWKGHWWARDGESLVPLNIHELEQIRNQTPSFDWSQQICKEATVEHLDPEAISKAREEFAKKNPALADEVHNWSDETFLNKSKVALNGKITNTAIMLLGKPEAVHFLSPSVVQLTWALKDEGGNDQDYEHFGPPLLLNVERLFRRIRNLRYRYLPDGTLFPIEVTKYEPWVIREALHNCIAHQDYRLQGRISVVEKPDELTFANVGSFLPGTVDAVIQRDSPPDIYRNPFLAWAMVNLNMIDTIGSGIKKMFLTQKERFFPLPDFDLTRPDRVVVKIQGKVLDQKYTRLLIEHADLDLATAILLDRVQKRLEVTKEQHRILKMRGFVEGRYPNLFLSSKIASAAEERVKYIKYRAFDDNYYQDMILEFIRKSGSATRSEIDDLIKGKLSDILSDRQKTAKISNLLTKMRKSGLLRNIGSRRVSKWVLDS